MIGDEVVSEGDDNGGGGGVGEGGQWEWWFSMGRVGGGPSYYPAASPTLGPSPKVVLSSLDTGLTCLVFLVPLVGFILILPSFRKKRWPSLLVVSHQSVEVEGVVCFVTPSYVIAS